MRYPAECPFTGQKNPRGAVRIERRQMQMFLPIPLVGFLKLRKVGRTVFPAARWIAIRAKILGVMPLTFFALGIGSFIWTKDKPYAWQFLLGGIALMYVSFGAKWLWVCRVRIVRIGTNSLEVRFASQTYAEEFCRLNELSCETKPTAKKADRKTSHTNRGERYSLSGPLEISVLSSQHPRLAASRCAMLALEKSIAHALGSV